MGDNGRETVTTTSCESCNEPFAQPGLGRARRFCMRCSPPSLPRLKRCAHGLPEHVDCDGCARVAALRAALPTHGLRREPGEARRCGCSVCARRLRGEGA
jgi:hypothetical protein